MRPGDLVRGVYPTNDLAIWATTNWGRLIPVDASMFHSITSADGLGEQGIAAGRNDFLTKPIRSDDVRRLLRSLPTHGNADH